MTERVGIIDLGSNSARLIIMNIYENGAYNLVYHQKEAVRLAEGMNAAGLLPEAAERGLNVIRSFSHMCRLFNVDRILAAATAAVRNAANGETFLNTVRLQTGIPLEIITEETEAMLGFIGVVNTIAVNDALLFDLGGGSIELTLIRNRRPVNLVSLPWGAVNLTERFGTQDRPTDSQLAELRAFLERQFEGLPWLKRLNLPIVGVGGTARNIAKIDQRRKNYPFSKVHNYRLGPVALEDLWRTIIKTSLAQRRKLPGLSSERADIIIAGVTMVRELFKYAHGTHLIISGCGLREGMFLRHYLSSRGESIIIPDILAHSTDNILRFYKLDEKHARHVAAMALALFDGWQALHGLETRERSLLQVAALLHDIGISINYYGHPRHSAYLVENARLFGLTHREQMLTAVVAGWHDGPAVKFSSRLYSEFLDEADWAVARKLALLLAMAEALDATEMGLVREAEARIIGGRPVLIVKAGEWPMLELQAVQKHAKWFRREMGYELTLENPDLPPGGAPAAAE